MADETENMNVYYDTLAWRADAIANLARASKELRGPQFINERAELLLTMEILRFSMTPKPNTAAVLPFNRETNAKLRNEPLGGNS
jgi:hypothetical protein